MNEYWRQREEQAQAEYALTEEQYAEQLNSIYDYMLDQVKKEINGFYSKYMSAENITYAEATKRVAELDIEEYERKAKKYVEEKNFSAQANEEMRLYNATMNINRLELLKANIGLEMVSNFDELNKVMGEDLTERALQEMARQAGILGATIKDNAKMANSIVGASFHNATFSDRIWMYQDQLKAELETLLRQGLIQGRNPNELARHINNLFDTGKYNCERLLRTELARVQSEAQMRSFTENGFDMYQFNALGTACPVCRALDGKHFRVADMMPGENAAPLHPSCRCTESAWMDDAAFNEWLDSYADHGMSYEDWLENRPTAVDNTSRSEALNLVQSSAQLDDIAYNEVAVLEKELTDEEIIEKISGGDETGGSCASLALAYIANKYGLNVTDFRGGSSQKLFAHDGTTKTIGEMSGVKSYILETQKSPLSQAGKFIKENVEDGRVYYFSGGKHAAAITRVGDSFKYLELQSANANSNGWQSLTTTVLNKRFKIPKNTQTLYGMEVDSRFKLIEGESLASNADFRTIMGYLNTSTDNQQKGERGNAK
ncbi:MAG: minor capsid protein [Bacteroidales bacterium]|nr:minor capsid protein [Bacteroidales bacterium]